MCVCGTSELNHYHASSFAHLLSLFLVHLITCGRALARSLARAQSIVRIIIKLVRARARVSMHDGVSSRVCACRPTKMVTKQSVGQSGGFVEGAGGCATAGRSALFVLCCVAQADARALVHLHRARCFDYKRPVRTCVLSGYHVSRARIDAACVWFGLCDDNEDDNKRNCANYDDNDDDDDALHISLNTCFALVRVKCTLLRK